MDDQKIINKQRIIKECKARYFQKKYYGDPEFRNKMIEDKRRYYQENKEKIAEYQRLKYLSKKKTKEKIQLHT